MSERRAVFLDRDGVINKPIIRDGKSYPPHTIDDFQLHEDTLEVCKTLKKAGFLLIVATNQPDVGRKTLKRESVEEIHRIMRQLLPLDDVEVCYASGRDSSEENAFRKPAPGMLLKAANKFSINLKKSYMIGDCWRDINCGHAAGCKTIFIDRGYIEALDVQPNYTVGSLKEAADIILKETNLTEE